MRGRQWFIFTIAVLGLVAAPVSAGATVLGVQVEVLVNNVSQGSALSSGGILDVSVSAGDTVRFLVSTEGTGSENMTFYETTVTTDDPSEIDYTVGSQVELSGLNFNMVANPDNTLNDGSPGVGAVNSGVGSVPNGTDTNLYRIDYVVQTPVTDAAVDFSVRINLTSATGLDQGAGTANVRLNAGVGVPEPGTILLLGTGLAAMAGFGRRRTKR